MVKKYEVLLSKEEMAQAEDLGDYYGVPSDLERSKLWQIS